MTVQTTQSLSQHRTKLFRTHCRPHLFLDLDGPTHKYLVCSGARAHFKTRNCYVSTHDCDFFFRVSRILGPRMLVVDPGGDPEHRPSKSWTPFKSLRGAWSSEVGRHFPLWPPSSSDTHNLKHVPLLMSPRTKECKLAFPPADPSGHRGELVQREIPIGPPLFFPGFASSNSKTDSSVHRLTGSQHSVPLKWSL